jgi:hypothetical protein
LEMTVSGAAGRARELGAPAVRLVRTPLLQAQGE